MIAGLLRSHLLLLDLLLLSDLLLDGLGPFGLFVKLRLGLHLLLSRLTFGRLLFHARGNFLPWLSDLFFARFFDLLLGFLGLLSFLGFFGNLSLLDQLHSRLGLDDLFDSNSFCESAVNFVFVAFVESEATGAVLLNVVEGVR